MSTIPFYAPERPESCVPACLRMVLASYGVERSEVELYTCCQTDVDGTLPSQAARCAQQCGFEATAIRLPDLDALMACLEITPSRAIAFINLSPIHGVNVVHAVIVETIDATAQQVHVVDPVYAPTGRRTWAIDLFVIG